MVFGIFLMLLFLQKYWIQLCNDHYRQATLQCNSYRLNKVLVKSVFSFLLVCLKMLTNICSLYPN